ncbi:MAG: hypothetical protein ACMG6E_09720 [Candidatus Roizmanbacteria bacterium]
MDQKLDVKSHGKMESVSVGRYLKVVFHQIVMKTIQFHRLLFECFDNTYFGSEKEI